MDEASLRALRGAGYDRLSMGAQSFEPRCWRRSNGCTRPTACARRSPPPARAGYDNVNLDLIYGANGETIDSWERTLRRDDRRWRPSTSAPTRSPIEPATPLGRAVASGATPEPDPDLQADMFGVACEQLAAAGYRHYEVSNWAKPGFECRHNLGYWERRPYLGLGAGAHSYRDDHRWWNTRPPEEYMERVERGELPVGGEEHLDPSDAYLEEVFLRMRILEGIPSSWIDETGVGAVHRERPARRRVRHLGAHRARHAAVERTGPGPHGRRASEPRRLSPFVEGSSHGLQGFAFTTPYACSRSVPPDGRIQPIIATKG